MTTNMDMQNTQQSIRLPRFYKIRRFFSLPKLYIAEFEYIKDEDKQKKPHITGWSFSKNTGKAMMNFFETEEQEHVEMQYKVEMSAWKLLKMYLSALFESA